MTDNNGKKTFWSTVCDNLKPILGLITALIMLYAAWVGLHDVGLHDDEPTPSPTPTPTTEFLTEPIEPIPVLTPTTPTSPPYVAPSPLSLTVQGTVTDENNMPVGGLKVSIDDLSDITGDDGIYIIRDVPVGVSIILVERMNEVVYRSACEIERSDGIKVVDISIPAEEPTTGEICLFSDGTSAVGADAHIDGEYQGRMFQSGINALFLITDIPPETYQIKVTKSGYQDFIGSVTVIAGQRTEIDFYFEPSPLAQLSTSPDPPSFDLGSMSAGETASRVFSISNAGGGTLEWGVRDDQPWMTVNPNSGTDSGTVTLNINTAGLSPGRYMGTITVTSNGGTRTGTISLTVPKPSPTDDISNFQASSVSDKKTLITVDYSYNTDHGDNVFLGAYALRDGKKTIWFGYGPARASRGSGSATISLTFGYNNPPTSVTTDQVMVNMYVGGGSAFYSETFDYTKTWSLGLAAPKQLSPADGQVFSHYPRTTTLEWSAVPDATSYMVEIEFCSPAGCDDWSVEYDPVTVTTTSYTFNFVGAQPGRWRVWAVSNGQESPKSDWWGFRYTR